MPKRRASTTTPVVSEGKTVPCELWPIDRPIDYPKNARKWSAAAVAKVAKSLTEFGFRQPIVVDEFDVIVIGHLRRAAARQAGFLEVPVHVAADLSAAQTRALRLMDNRSHDEAEWAMDLLAEEMRELAVLDIDLSITGFDAEQYLPMLGGAETLAVAEARATLAERFVVPPFSVLDARQGYWQDRKRAWLALGIQSEIGRGADLIPNGGGMTSKTGYRREEVQDRLSPGGSPRPACDYANRERGDGRGRPTERGVVRETAK